MTDEQPPLDDSREPAFRHRFFRAENFQERSSLGLKIAFLFLLPLAVIATSYAWLQHHETKQLAADRADLRASLAQAKSQVDVLAAKVNALTAAQAEAEQEQQAEAARRLAEAATNEQFPPQTSTVTRHKARGRGGSPCARRWPALEAGAAATRRPAKAVGG